MLKIYNIIKTNGAFSLDGKLFYDPVQAILYIKDNIDNGPLIYVPTILPKEGVRFVRKEEVAIIDKQTSYVAVVRSSEDSLNFDACSLYFFNSLNTIDVETWENYLWNSLRDTPGSYALESLVLMDIREGKVIARKDCKRSKKEDN